ncbi:cupin domain-containing protein, partial [Acinetobacter baumannii]
IPPGQSSGALCTYKTATDKYLVVHEGRLTVRIGESRHVLETGDSLYFEIKRPYRFDNEGEAPCAYYLVAVRKG